MKTFYEHFGYFSKEQIDAAIELLCDEDKELIRKRYNDDLTETIQGNMTRHEIRRFYGHVMTQMRRILDNNTSYVKRTKKTYITADDSQDNSLTDNLKKSTKEISVDFSDSSLFKFSGSVLAPDFKTLLSILSTKEAVIASLKLGYIDNKYFSDEAIATFLNVSIDEINEINEKIFIVYQELVKRAFSNMADEVNEHIVKKRILK